MLCTHHHHLLPEPFNVTTTKSNVGKSSLFHLTLWNVLVEAEQVLELMPWRRTASCLVPLAPAEFTSLYKSEPFSQEWQCPKWAGPSPPTAVSSQDNLPTDVATDQCDLGIPSANAPSFQVTLGCIKSKVRTNQDTIKKKKNPGLMVHTCHPRTGKVETGGAQ